MYAYLTPFIFNNAGCPHYIPATPMCICCFYSDLHYRYISKAGAVVVFAMQVKTSKCIYPSGCGLSSLCLERALYVP